MLFEKSQEISSYLQKIISKDKVTDSENVFWKLIKMIFFYYVTAPLFIRTIHFKGKEDSI